MYYTYIVNDYRYILHLIKMTILSNLPISRIVFHDMCQFIL